MLKAGKIKEPHLNISKALALEVRDEEKFDVQYGDVAQFAKARFWDKRYAEDTEAFEWYWGYDKFREYITAHIRKDVAVLDAGCGSSHLLEDMADDGYTNLVGIDISRVVLSQMKSRCVEYSEIQFLQANMCDTNLPAKSYDAIIDKGLLDSVICSPSGDMYAYVLVNEIGRLLSDEGIYICISHANPEERLKYLEQYDWDLPGYTPWYITVEVVTIPLEYDSEQLDVTSPDSVYWVYICKMDEKLVARKNRKVALQDKKDRMRKTRKGAFPL